jgi:YggT family protein
MVARSAKESWTRDTRLAFVNFIGQIVELVLGTFIVLLFVRLIVDWIQIFARSWTPRGPVLVVLEGVYTITDPPVKALRKIIPPLRLGGVAIDLSFVALLLICYILLSVNRALLLS